MSGSVFSSSAFAAFAAAIRQRESTNNNTSKNSQGYMGAYQMQEPALKDAGFQDAHGNWTALAKSLGVPAGATFRSTPSAQDVAFQNYTEKNFEYLHNYRSYIGKTVGGILITESGMLVGAHLTGQDSVKKFLASDGTIDRHDKNGVFTSQYMKQFAGYDFTFPSKSKGFSPAVNMPQAQTRTVTVASSLAQRLKYSTCPAPPPKEHGIMPDKPARTRPWHTCTHICGCTTCS